MVVQHFVLSYLINQFSKSNLDCDHMLICINSNIMADNLTNRHLIALKNA